MSIEVKVPVLPESVSDATIATWHKKVGDAVKRDENLVDLETDKVVLEVPATVDGVLKEIRHAEGDTVNSEQVIAVIEEGAAAPAPAKDEPKAAAPAPAKAEAAAPKASGKGTEELSPAGRRVAEEEIFGYDKVTSGASADIKMATGLARAMATEFGMSDKLGPLLYGDNQDELFLGRSMMQRSTHLSDETQQLVDAEVKRFVEEGYQMARKVILENIDDLHAIAGALLEYETLTGDEIRDLLNGKPPYRPDSDVPAVKSTGVPKIGRAVPKKPSPDTDGGLEPQPEG